MIPSTFSNKNLVIAKVSLVQLDFIVYWYYKTLDITKPDSQKFSKKIYSLYFLFQWDILKEVSNFENVRNMKCFWVAKA